MKLKKDSIWICLFIFFASLFVFSNGLNIHGVEFRDDEIFYVKSTIEMSESGNILSPKYFGEDRFQKPILFYWLILFSYKCFGSSWFAARFVSSVFAAMTLVVTWLIAKSLFGRKIAGLSTIILLTGPLFFRHAKNAVPDMALNFFIVLAIYYFVRFTEEKYRTKYSILFFVSCALGFMIKGFAALIVPFSTVLIYGIAVKQWTLLKEMKFLRGVGIVLLIVVPWFLYMLKIHGMDYLNYMWFHETTGRLLHVKEGNVFLVKIKSFLEHLLFYFQIILQQFVPWSIFSVVAVGLAGQKIKNQENEPEVYVFLLTWIFSTYFFFSFMYFTISHYMLVISTPLAILTSDFLLRPFNENSLMARSVFYIRKYCMLLIFTILVLAYTFVMVFIAGVAKIYLLVLGLFYIVIVVFMHQSRSLSMAPWILGLFLIGVSFQSPQLSQLGLTTHATLSKFAKTINQQHLQEYVIGVASHDLHEKEFQTYFPTVKVQKIANNNDEYTADMMIKFFRNKESAYCLITEKDYNKHLNRFFKDADIIHQEFMLRKRLSLDWGFVKALFKLDQKKIYEYFMEKVVLVKREKNV